MQIITRKSFIKDLKTIAEPSFHQRLKKILLLLEEAEILDSATVDCVKMKGFEGYYRIRIGSYRVGLHNRDGAVHLLRAGHRSHIYKDFP